MIVDVADVTNPTSVGLATGSNIVYPYEIRVSAGLAYLTGEVSEYIAVLHVVDVTDPANPLWLWSAGLIGATYPMGSAVCFAGYQFYTVDMSDPDSPQILDSLPLPGFGYDVIVDGGIAYVAASDAGIRVIDVSDPYNISEIGFYDTPGWAFQMAVQDSLIYVADDDALLVLKTGPCCQTRGDADRDGSVNIVDVTYLVAHLFGGGPAPPCFEEGDCNADGAVNIVDLTYLVAHLFGGGSAPEPCP